MKKLKPQKLNQRLQVVRTTVRKLDDQQLENVNGGRAASAADPRCGGYTMA